MEVAPGHRLRPSRRTTLSAVATVDRWRNGMRQHVSALLLGWLQHSSTRAQSPGCASDPCRRWYGSGAKLFSKSTLKSIAERTIYGLLRYDATAGETRFEASDVIRVDDHFYVVCDSSWSILKISDGLPLLSRDNQLIRHDASFQPPSHQDSGFEAIIHDMSSFFARSS